MNKIAGFTTVTKSTLEAAWMAELIRAPRTEEARAFTSEIVEATLAFETKRGLRQRKRRKNDLRNFERGLGALLGDLMRHASNSDAAGFMYRSSDREKFSSTLCSNRVFVPVTKQLWPQMGLLEVTKGFQTWDDFDGKRIRGHGKAQRLRATPALLGIAAQHGITADNASEHFSVAHDSSLPVEVRGRKQSGRQPQTGQVSVASPKSVKLQVNLELVRDLNRFLEEHVFSLPEVPRFKRTFNNGHLSNFDYDQGGRLYCTSKPNYQNLHRDERAKTLIDGKSVSEIDVSSSQLSIFYWLQGKTFQPEQDQYDLPGIERDVAKRVLVSAFGAGKMPTRWPKGYKAEYESQTGRSLIKTYKLKNVVAALEEKHPILRRLDPDRPEWPRLQFHESEAVIGSVMELKDKHGILALPIHDSLIVKRFDREIAGRVLARQYCDRFGFEPKITVKY